MFLQVTYLPGSVASPYHLPSMLLVNTYFNSKIIELINMITASNVCCRMQMFHGKLQTSVGRTSWLYMELLMVGVYMQQKYSKC